MPLVDGEYQKLSEDEIRQRLERNLEEKLGASATAGSLVQKQLEAEAKTLAQNQEEALERVHKAAYLADAEGKELDKVVDVIGLTRRPASSATGVARFWRETPPKTTYTIPGGSTVQTPGNDPIQFNVRDQDKLAHIDGWEDGDLNGWVGDTSPFSVKNTTEMTGNHALEVPATSGVKITTEDDSFGIGTRFGVNLKPVADSTTAIQFGVQDDSNYLECVVDEYNQELNIRLVEGGSQSAISSNTSATIPADYESYLEIKWGRYTETEAALYESKHRDTKLCSVTLDENKEWKDGAVAIKSKDSQATCLVDEATTREVLVDIEAEDAGTQTNVGPNSITVIPNGISGVEEVTNPIQTGNPNKRDSDFSALVLGEDREDDEALRERAYNTTDIGGAATANALDAALKRVEGVDALTLKRNRENSSIDGLPPHSFEAIVYGGSDKEVADAIFSTASIDSNDVGGIHGSEVNYTITSDVTKSEETISWSRPVTVGLDITVELIVDDTFDGEAEVKSIITNYIGGTDIDGSFVSGQSVGEDIYESILKRHLVNPEETGIWEVSSLIIDSNGDGTDDTTTNSSGAEVFEVADNEVAVTNARDDSITVNTTQK